MVFLQFHSMGIKHLLVVVEVHHNTNDEKLFKLASHKSKTARASEEYIHDMVGFNYRMTNIQAALEVAQLERFEEFISKKIEIFNFYEQNIQLENIKFINLKDLKSSDGYLSDSRFLIYFSRIYF